MFVDQVSVVSYKLWDQLVNRWRSCHRDTVPSGQENDSFHDWKFIQLNYCTCQNNNNNKRDRRYLSMIFHVNFFPNGVLIPNEYAPTVTLLHDSSSTMILHPQVEEFLLFSSMEFSLHSSKSSSTSFCDGCCFQNQAQNERPIPITLTTIFPTSVSTPTKQHSQTFLIQPISSQCILLVGDHDENDDDQEEYKQNPIHVSIQLDFISSTEESYTTLFHSLFSSSSSSYSSSDKSATNQNHSHSITQNQNYIISLLKSRLQGRLIQQDTCIAFSLPFTNTTGHPYPSINTSNVVVFFYISSVTQHDPPSSICNTYYYIESSTNVTIHITSINQYHDDNTYVDYNSVDSNSYNKLLPMITMPTYTMTCPGYEKLLNELLVLSRITSTIASPSAILLLGCHGVGKTRLVTTFLHHYQKESKENQITLQIQYLSINDLLSIASTFQSMEELIQQVFPNLLWNKNKKDSMRLTSPTLLKSNSRNVLILDDLDLLLDEDNDSDESTVQSDYNIRIARYAIIDVMDRLISTSQDHLQSHPLILGIGALDTITKSNILVRTGRFEKIIYMHPPTEYQRCQMIEYLLSDLPLIRPEHESKCNSDLNSDHQDTVVMPYSKDHMCICHMWAKILASQTAGCIAGDMNRIIRVDALTRAMSNTFSSRTSTQLDEVCDIQDRILRQCTSCQYYALSWEDLKEATRSCIPSQLVDLDVSLARTWDDETLLYESSTKESWKRLFDLSWAYFGGYKEMKDRLYQTVVRPWRASFQESYGSEEGPWKLSRPTGVLFHGPSGTGKSLAAECLASSLSLNIIKVRASNVLDKWLGGSEAIVRSIFARARSAAPCILLFDDIDSISSNRENDGEGGSGDVYSRVLSTLLNEMDGVSSDTQGNGSAILVVATSNRLEDIDAALLRPGRFDVHINIQKPRAHDATEIFRLKLSKVRIHSDVDLMNLAEKVINLNATGANIEGLCEQVCMIAIDREDSDHVLITMEDFDAALKLSFLGSRECQ